MAGSGFRRFLHAQELDFGRREQDFAERVHPVAGLFAGLDAALAELLELVEARELDLELEPRAAVPAREGHEEPQAQK